MVREMIECNQCAVCCVCVLHRARYFDDDLISKDTHIGRILNLQPKYLQAFRQIKMRSMMSMAKQKEYIH